MIKHESLGTAVAETARFSPRKGLSATPGVVFPLLLLCAAINAVNFLQLFRSKLSASSYLLIGILCLALVVVYNAFPYYSGVHFSWKNSGLKTNDLPVILLSVLTCVCMAAVFVLRVQTKDYLIPPEVDMAPGETVIKSDHAALIVAIMLGLVPVVTSCLTFCLSFCFNAAKHPAEEPTACENHKKAIDEEIIKMRMTISEPEVERNQLSSEITGITGELNNNGSEEHNYD